MGNEILHGAAATLLPTILKRAPLATRQSWRRPISADLEAPESKSAPDLGPPAEYDPQREFRSPRPEKSLVDPQPGLDRIGR